MSALRAIAVVGVLVLACASRVHAQVPPCEGDDAAAAATALDEGDRAADRAAAALQRHHAGDAEAAWSEALAAYDRACAAGEDQALERRAIPLFRLGRVAEAASSLDTFLADHPADQLDRAQARRVAANLRAIERRVATLVITPTPLTAVVTVGGIERGVGTVRVRVAAETSVTVVARAEGYARFRLSSTYSVGEHEVRADLIATEEVAPETEVEDEAIAPIQTERVLAVYPAPPRERTPLLIPGIVLAGLAGVAAIWGALFVVESETDALQFIGNRGDAGLVGGGLLIGAGVVGTTALILLILHATRHQEPQTSLLCVPTLGGVGCSGTF